MDNRLNTVFILGAGASADVGIPLMKNFLDEAENLYRLGIIRKKDDYDLVFQAHRKLQRVYSKSIIDLINIESVLSAFEMGKLLQVFLDYEPSQINTLVEAAKDLIKDTITNTIKFNTVRNEYLLPPYNDFTNLVKVLQRSARPSHDVSIITFNYDIAVEYSFQIANIDFNYSLGNDINGNGIDLLKLHGSLNWTTCNKCDVIVPFSNYRVLLKMDSGTTKHILLSCPRANNTDCECDNEQNDNSKPVIVPPIINKTYYYNQINNVWRKAAIDLQKAENVFVIGYSLPESDYFFKYLYGLGTASETLLRKFWVFNPDKSVESRFLQLLGEGAKSRFQFFERDFRAAITIINDAFSK